MDFTLFWPSSCLVVRGGSVRIHRKSCCVPRQAIRAAGFLCVLLTLLSFVAPAQVSQSDLTQLNIEDLMKVEVVSVSKREQTLSETAAPSSSYPEKTSADPAQQIFPISCEWSLAFTWRKLIPTRGLSLFALSTEDSAGPYLFWSMGERSTHPPSVALFGTSSICRSAISKKSKWFAGQAAAFGEPMPWCNQYHHPKSGGFPRHASRSGRRQPGPGLRNFGAWRRNRQVARLSSLPPLSERRQHGRPRRATRRRPLAPATPRFPRRRSALSQRQAFCPGGLIFRSRSPT
jgi:hypothetical protein